MATSIGTQFKTATSNASDYVTLGLRKLGLETVSPGAPLNTTPVKPFNYVSQKSPEETSGSSTKDPKLLSFPSDLENVNYFITFTFSSKNYHNAEFAVNGTDDITYRIRLPMPNNLIDSFKTNYQGTSLGTFTGYALQSGVLNDLYDIMSRRVGREITPEEVRNYAINRATNIKDDFKADNAILESAIRYALQALPDSIGKGFDYVSGTTLNPYQHLFFEGVDLRSHNFSFKLSPNSPDESRALRRILNVFKTRMLPEKKGLLLTYPDSCIIELSTRKNPYSLYTMYRSVLSGVNINYAPNNVPVFFKGGYEPVEVALDLSFSEVRPVTREDLKDASNYLTDYYK